MIGDFQDLTPQKEIEAKIKRKRKRHLNDICKIVSMPEGRRVLFAIFKETGVWRSSFTGNSTTFFNEGARNVGLVLLRDLMEAKPEAFNQMMRENYSEIKSYQKLQEKKHESTK
jgi:hypothetical protein